MSAALKMPEPMLEDRQLLAALRAFRRGDFSVRLPRDLDGIDGEIAETFNEVVDLAERKAKEIGKEHV